MIRLKGTIQERKEIEKDCFVRRSDSREREEFVKKKWFVWEERFKKEKKEKRFIWDKRFKREKEKEEETIQERKKKREKRFVW